MQQETPLHFYKKQLDKTAKKLAKLKKKSNEWLIAKIIIFLAGAVCIYLGFTQGWSSYIYAIVLAFVCYLIATQRDAVNLKRIEQARRMKQTLEYELKALQGDFSHFPDGREYIDSSHEYTYDLDIFGEKSLFQRLNRTITQEGSNCLAKWLSHYPMDEKVTEERKAAIRELSGKRKRLMNFIAVPRQKEDRLRKYVSVLQERMENTTPVTGYFNKQIIMACILLALTWGILIACIAGVCSWYLFGLMFFIQLLTGFSLSKRSGKMIGETEGLHKSFSPYLSILRFADDTNTDIFISIDTSQKPVYQKDIHKRYHFQTPYLLHISKSLSEAEKSFKTLSHLIQALYCRMNDVMFVLLNGMLLFDVFLLRAYDCWKQKTIVKMPMWIDQMAETDALVSLAVYRFNHPENTEAQFADDASADIIEAEGLYHPFLPADKAVGNDLTLKADEMIIVTGANMAGKSTFLRTVGINYVMAMNGLPVCASAFTIRKTALFSSMRTADNLSANISYFHAELLRLEQLVDFCKKQPHTLIILDEILKGTNSEDKLKGSVLFLKKIRQLPVTGIVATHDLKLSELEAEDPHFQNYCFEIGLGKEISYSYKIKKGVARNLNATYLLNEILEKISPQ